MAMAVALDVVDVFSSEICLRFVLAAWRPSSDLPSFHIHAPRFVFSSILVFRNRIELSIVTPSRLLFGRRRRRGRSRSRGVVEVGVGCVALCPHLLPHNR